jgi:hypothetical protein
VIYPINGNGQWCKMESGANGWTSYLDLANKEIEIATNFP